MIDHILTFATEAAAHAALDPLGYGGVNNSVPFWDTSRCIPNVKIMTTAPVYDAAVPPNLVTPAVYKPNWWILISLPAQDSALQALGSISSIYNRDTNSRIWVTANALQAIALASTRISPVFAGSAYVYGV